MILRSTAAIRPGLPDFLGTRYQTEEKIYQMTTKFIRYPQNRPNGHKICRDFPLQDPTKFTQIGIFGSKTNHLATLY
jgi:hypothetical protein